MSGKWLKPEVHVCDKPMLVADNPDVAIGDRWRCDFCLVVAEVTGLRGWDSKNKVAIRIKWDILVLDPDGNVIGVIPEEDVA